MAPLCYQTPLAGHLLKWACRLLLLLSVRSLILLERYLRVCPILSQHWLQHQRHGDASTDKPHRPNSFAVVPICLLNPETLITCSSKTFALPTLQKEETGSMLLVESMSQFAFSHVIHPLCLWFSCVHPADLCIRDFGGNSFPSSSYSSGSVDQDSWTS